MTAHRDPATQDRLRQNELYRVLVASVKDYAIFLLDPEGYVLTWNEGARRIKGYEAADIVGSHFSRFYTPPDLGRGLPVIALETARREGTWHNEGWRVRKDGTLFWAEVVITALFGDDGELLGFAKVTHDLTERRASEEERRQLLLSEQAARAGAERALDRLRAIQSLTEAALAHLNLEDLLSALVERIGRMLQADSVVVFMLGEHEPDVLTAISTWGLEAETELNIRVPVSTTRAFAGRIAANRRPASVSPITAADVANPRLREYGMQSLLGVPLVTDGRVLGVVQAGSRRENGFNADDVELLQVAGDRAALAIDRAQLHRRAVNARREAEVAEEMVRSRDHFLSIAAHELRTPMAAVRLSAQMLLRLQRGGQVPDPDRLRSGLETIDRQVNRLSRLVTQLLETVRVQAGRMELERRPVDLVALVRDQVESVRQQNAGHQILFHGPETLPARVDDMRLEQVVANLLDNAVKFSPGGGKIEVSVEEAPPAAAISVRDHGLGVAPEHRAHLFEQFFQAHPDHRTGMGLGLYLSRQIVDAHGGTLSAEWPEDGGTLFRVTLPR